MNIELESINLLINYRAQFQVNILNYLGGII